MIVIKNALGLDIPGLPAAAHGQERFVALENDRVAAWCTFVLDGDAVRVTALWSVDDDPLLADGVMRAAAASARDCARDICCDTGALPATYIGYDKRLTGGQRLALETFLRGQCHAE